MTKKETQLTTTSTTSSSSTTTISRDDSSSGGRGPEKAVGGGARKLIPLTIRAPPPPHLSPPAVTAMTVSIAPAIAAQTPGLQDFSPRGMAHNLTTELVATTTMTTGYVWDIDALVMLQAAAEDFLNGLTEVQLGELAQDFENFVRGLGQQY